MSQLFSEFRLREITFRNRVWVSPMCQYSSVNGFPNDWHFVHLGSRAIGGAGLVMVEATATSPEGRISPQDSGIYLDEHVPAFARVTAFLRAHGAVAGIQLAHAGRKASTQVPWDGNGAVAPAQGGWATVGPSPLAFRPEWPAPRALSESEVRELPREFAAAASRAIKAGFQVVELHFAHGYLMHEFLSPLSNQREDRYGGSLENRLRLPIETAQAVRAVLPAGTPLLARISATDWAPDGWDLEQSVTLSQALKGAGVDLIDCSSGGNLPHVKIPTGPGYQISFAQEIRARTGLPVAAVGEITSAEQAESVVVTGQADAVFLARQMLRDPYWPLHASRALKSPIPYPKQYARAD